MAVTLADRIAKQAKVQARAEAGQAKLKIYVRKARTRNLIAAGALIEQAGLLELGPDELLRMLQACQAVLSKSGPEKLILALEGLQAHPGRLYRLSADLPPDEADAHPDQSAAE
jgi:Conjugal transfer protein TraD